MIRESDKDETKGRIKEAAGSLTGNDEMRREGKTDQAKASVKDAIENVKDKATDAVDAITGKGKNK